MNSQIESKDEGANRRKFYTVVSVIILLALFIAGTAFLGPPIVSTVKTPEKFRAFIDSYGAMGRLVFLGIQALQVVFALIPGEVIEVGAGYAFGVAEGTLLCLFGAAAASLLIFFLVRFFGHRLASGVLDSDKLKKFKFLHNTKQLTLVVFLLFLIPGTPKDLLTYFVGLTKIKVSRFILITTIARIPSIISSVYAGAKLNEQNYTATIIVFAVTFLLSAAGFLIYNKIISRKEKNETDCGAAE